MSKYNDEFGLKLISPTHSARLRNFEEFGSWLLSLGVRIESTRLVRYRKFLEIQATRENGIEVKGDLNDELMLGKEVDELLWIYSALKYSIPDGAIGLLEKIMGGSEYANQEGSNTKARNFQLELRIAAYFIKAGYEVDLSQDSDIIVKIDDVLLFVECKRLDSKLKVEKRAKLLAQQLKKRYTLKQKCFGLAIFDVGRIVDPEQGISIARNFLTGRDGVRDMLVKFSSQYDVKTPFEADNRFISIWLQALIPTLHLEEDVSTTRFSSYHISFAKPGSEKEYLFNKLKAVFEIR